MTTLGQSVSLFLNTASRRLGELISQEISWRPLGSEPRDSDAQWWCCALTVDSECRFYAGASRYVWEEMRHEGDAGFTVLAEAIERAAAERFGSEVRCASIESCDAPPQELSASVWETSAGPIEVAMSSAAVDALGGGSVEESATTFPAEDPIGNPMDMLLHVEIPVSVSLGRTKMRIKDLVGLSHGSVVELDQELGDQVEIRVNNCVIARGEVVAVDGNYGVRIMSMVPNGQGSRGLLSKNGSTK
jgi:flagellar motor switch protein FliN